jgi:hypothetical protein
MSSNRIILLSVIILSCSASSLSQQSPMATSTSTSPPEVMEPVDATFIPKVESKTEALQLVSAVRRDPFIRIRLKNVSDKSIYAFRMSYHKSGAAVLFSFIMADDKKALAPGEVYKYEYSFSANSTMAREPLTFEAVLFEDGSGAGEANKVKSLQDIFLTNRKQLENVIALLQAAIDSPNVETLSSLPELEKKLSEVPNYMSGVALEGMVGLTLPSWKDTALHLVLDLKRLTQETTGVKIQEELSKIKDRFGKTLAKYPGTI